MKRRELLARVAAETRRQGKRWELLRQGSNHEIWRCGSIDVAVPRHPEINEWTAIGIYRSLEGELGKDWWRG
jgi:hypothetical protein